MAARKTKKSTSITRRRSGNPTADKLRARMASAQRRRATEKKQRLQDMSAVAGGAALGAIDRFAPDLPFDIPGVPESGVYAAAAYFIGDQFLSGKTGEMVRGAGVGMMACAARELVAELGE